MPDAKIGDQVMGGVDAATEKAGELAGKAQTAAAQASSTLQEAATQAGETAAKTYGQAAEYVKRNTAEQPLMALLVAGVIGYAIAYMIHSR